MALPSEPAPPGHGISQREATRVWLRIALLSFGGPAGQIAVMHRLLVEEKRWISETRFLHALNYCMLLPGPEAQQLATYVGWLMHRTRGGLIAGLLFILPGVIAILALSIVYVTLGENGLVSSLFFGLKAAVLAIVLQAVWRIGKRVLRNALLLGLSAAAFVGIFLFGVPFPAIILAAGAIGYLGGRFGLPEFGGDIHGGKTGGNPPADLIGNDMPAHAVPTWGRSLRVALVWLPLWLAPVAVLLVTRGSGDVFAQIAVFFSKMAVVTFGGAYAVLAYVAQEAVDSFHWLRPGEMLDGLGMAETTPGPLIMVLQFVGFIAAYRGPGLLPPIMAGVFGGLVATWVTFAPCFFWIFLGAPFVEKLRGNRALGAALTAITASVVGVILNLAVWFAIHATFRQTFRLRDLGLNLDVPVLASVDAWALALSLAAAVALFRFQASMHWTLAGASLAGLLLYFLGAIG